MVEGVVENATAMKQQNLIARCYEKLWTIYKAFHFQPSEQLSPNNQGVSSTEDALLRMAAESGGGEDLADLISDQYFPSVFANGNIKGDTVLHDAARSADSRSIEAILNDEQFSRSKNFKEALCRKRNEFGNTALHEAVMKGDVEGVELLFSADRAVAHYPNKECKSPLYLAIENRNEQIVDILFPSVSSFLYEHIWRQQEQSSSAATVSSFLLSSASSSTDDQQLLIQQQYSSSDATGSTLVKSNTIMKRLKNEERKKREIKAEEMQRLGQPSNSDLTLQLENYEATEILAPEIHKTIKQQNVFIFASKLEQRCIEEQVCLSDIVNGVSPTGDTLLHIAANFESQEIVQLIASHFPQLIIRRNIKGDTPLHVAARNRNLHNMIIILACHTKHCENGVYKGEEELVLCRTKNEFGNTALHETVMLCFVEGASLLLSIDKVVVHYLNKEGKSPLYLAVEYENKELVDVLLYAPFHNVERHRGNSPLHAAVLETSSGGFMKKLLDKRPELIHLRDQKGGTPFHCAASIGHREAVLTLLRVKPLSTLERNSRGYLPIHVACKKGHVNVVKDIVEQEWLDPLDLLNKKGQNILHVAAKNGKQNVVSYILREKKLEKLLNEKDKNGNTPLHLASKNLLPMILILLTKDKRVNVNTINNQRMTPRDYVVHRRREVLHKSRAVLSSGILSSAGTPTSEKTFHLLRKTHPEKIEYWLKERNYTLMFVGILVATVTFAAGFTMPGGFNGSDGSDPGKRGMATLVNRRMFQVFTICDSIAMYCSTIGSVIMMWAQLGDFQVALLTRCFALLLIGLALVTMSIAFMAGVHLVVSNLSWLANVVISIGIIFLSLFLFAYLLLIFPFGCRAPVLRLISDFLCRILIPLVGGYGKLPKKKKKTTELEQQSQKNTRMKPDK